MKYFSYHPDPPLNDFVEYFWLIEGGQASRLEKILPCGSIELVINLKNDEIHIHDPLQPKRYQRFSGAVFSGTYSRSFICNALQHEAIMGVHFKAGGAFAFVDIDTSEVTNTHVDAADLWGTSAHELHDRLCTAIAPQHRFRIMENALQSRLHNTTHRLQMKFALEMFGKGALVRDVSRELGFPQRRFIQMFSSHVGLTPKVFSRVVRFQHARVLAEKLQTPDWAELALTCGYFDQSHLIKDFQEFSGSTPRTYSQKHQHKDARLKDNHLPLR